MKSFFKVLTFIILSIGITGNLFAEVVTQETSKTHLRWKVKATEDQVKISKRGSKVLIQSLDPDFFEKFSADIAKIKSNKNYYSKLNFKAPTSPGNPYKLEISLKDDSIELFSFYKREERNYVLDFWINQDVIATKKAAIAAAKPKKIKVAKLRAKKKTVKKAKKPVSNKVSKVLGATNKFNVINPDEHKARAGEKAYRDFRYGAAFIWDYKALIPPLERDINLKVKAPDFLYKVKDMRSLDGKKSSHMQLTINFYRQSKWGLMTRSINLYEEKYGSDKNKVLNDFMKAVSMIRNATKQRVKPEYSSKIDENGEIVPADDFSVKAIKAAARNLLAGVSDASTDYDLTKATLRYLIQSARDEDDYINTLKLAKNLYVKASEQFDDDMIIYSSRVILNSLANLRQLDKIKSFLSNKAVLRVLPKQEGMAYIGFVNLEKGEIKQVISNYKANERSLSKPIHPSILFNTAESLFRVAKYKQAIKLFDEFASQYSFFTKSGSARLRIALGYDLLGQDVKKVLRLYKDAINKSPNLAVRYEAKMRYVGLRVARKRTPSQDDLETIVFLDGTEAEKAAMALEHKKLLWLTRLRTLISSEKYADALAYMTTLPLENARVVEQRSFNADGAEIILGMIKKSYLDGDYAQAVKVWEIYKDKYENKVAKSPYLAFIVSDSYLKLGLSKSFDRSVKTLEKLNPKRIRTFPLWVKPHKNIAVTDYLVELKLNKYQKDGDFKGLGQYLETVKSNKNINYKFYNGLVSYKLKNYNKAVTSYESILVQPNLNNILTPSQSKLMLETYLEALYETASSTKFRKNAAALTNDLRRDARYEELIERSEYLYIESLFSDKNVNYKLLSRKTDEFLKENTKSSYQARVKYLRGVALVNSDNKVEGTKLLTKLLEDKEVPEYLKSLARSELSTLKLQDKIL